MPAAQGRASPRPPTKGGNKGAARPATPQQGRATGKGAARPPAQPPAQKKQPAGAPQAPAGPPQKRVAPATAFVPGAKRQGTGPQTYSVYSNNDNDELGIVTLLGEYVEHGTHHGKKTFRRKPKPDDPDDSEVFIYFFDNREGAENSGWWFGNAVGGEQVYSRNAKADPTPPKSGWHIPYDGPPNKDLVVELHTAKTRPGVAKEEPKLESKEELADLSAPVSSDERVQIATDRVAIAECEATQVLESAEAMLEGEVDEAAVKSVEELLLAQQSALTDTHKVLAADIMDANQAAPGIAQSLRNLTPRVRTVQASLAQKIKQVKVLRAERKSEAEAEKKREEERAQIAEAEQRDAKTLEEALPEALRAICKAEEFVESVEKTAAPLSQEAAEGADDVIKATEATALKAEEAIKEARQAVTKQVLLAKKFAPEAKRLALTEFSALQDKLKEANKRMTPYRNVRGDFEQKLKSRQAVDFAAKQLAEVQVKVAQLDSAALDIEACAEQAKAAEASLASVTSALGEAMTFLDERVEAAQGPLKEDLAATQAQGAELQKMLEGLRTQLVSRRETLQIGLLLKQALNKAEAAEEGLSLATQAQASLLKELGSLSGEKAGAAVRAAKEPAEAAQEKVLQAKAFLKSRIAEVKRFPQDSQETMSAELGQLQDRVEAASQQLTILKREMEEREVGLVLKEVTQKVASAEAAVKQLFEVTSPLEGGQAEELAVARLRELADKALEVERAASAAGHEAHKTLRARQAAPLARESALCGAELEGLQKRLREANQEHSKRRKLAIDGDRVCKARLLLEEREEQMRKLEAEVERVDVLTTPLDDELPSEENAQEAIRALEAVEVMAADLREALEEAAADSSKEVQRRLAKLSARSDSCQARVDQMNKASVDMRRLVNRIRSVQEARLKLERVEVSFRKVSEAEMPFLKGTEMPAEEASKAIADCEAAYSAVQKTIVEAQSFLRQCTNQLREHADEGSETSLRELEDLDEKNKEHSKQLSQFKRETDDRKRAALEREADTAADEAEAAIGSLERATTASTASEEGAAAYGEDLSEKMRDAQKEAEERLAEAQSLAASRRPERRRLLDASTTAKMDARLDAAEAKLASLRSLVSEYEEKRQASA